MTMPGAPSDYLSIVVDLWCSLSVSSFPHAHRSEAIHVLTDACASSCPPHQRTLLQYNLALIQAESGDCASALQHVKEALEALGSAPTCQTATPVQIELKDCSLVLLALLLSARYEHSFWRCF